MPLVNRKPQSELAPRGSIKLEHISITYPIYTHLVWDRLREFISPIWPKLKPKSKHVLKDISLEIEPGDIVGFVGVNGAGKTTLLKIISQMIKPTSGHCHISGKVMALLAMGMGFKANFTGRENIYYGGLLMGLKKKHIDELIDDIAKFAALGLAFEQPYFTYSSGMRARLGFALATSIPSDILILDETLATGDRQFVSRCYARIQALQQSKCTILFVSHNLGEVARMTERVIVLSAGKKHYDGPTLNGIAAYETLLLDQPNRLSSDSAKLYTDIVQQLSMINDLGKSITTVHTGLPTALKLTINCQQDIGEVYIYLRVSDITTGNLISYLMPDRTETLTDAKHLSNSHTRLTAGTTEITWHFPQWVLGEGRYQFDTYIGPPATSTPQVECGRTWYKSLIISTTFANPYLKSANTLVELPFECTITHNPAT